MKKLLYRFTARLPVRFIAINGRPYLERYHLGTVAGLTFDLHRFINGDLERELHDHPWRHAVAIVLAGRYVEERLTALSPERGILSRQRTRRAGAWNHIGWRDFHRVASAERNTWTLFAHGPTVKAWAFLSRIPNYPERGLTAVLYSRSKGSDDAPGWWRQAPLGRDAGREPFQAP